MEPIHEEAMPVSVEQAVERVLQLEAELEASGDTATEGEALARARDILHRWVDTVTGVVSTPGVGRVALIHENGRRSSVASPDLAMLLSMPPSFWNQDDRDRRDRQDGH